jgi:ribosome-binding protein aMBF1 (putative translation factor)
MYKICQLDKCVGNAIRENRRRAAISQTALAGRAGAARRVVQEVENGRSDHKQQDAGNNVEQ